MGEEYHIKNGVVVGGPVKLSPPHHVENDVMGKIEASMYSLAVSLEQASDALEEMRRLLRQESQTDAMCAIKEFVDTPNRTF